MSPPPTPSTLSPPGHASASVLDRLLRLGADVRGGEGPTAILLSMAGFLTLASNGNYILDETLTESARAVAGTSAGLSERQFIGAFRAEMDFYQNILVVLIQFFLVSRIFKYVGVGGALFIPPLLALIHYGAFAAWPVLALIRIGKIAENATDYSLQNTLRRAGSRDVLLARR